MIRFSTALQLLVWFSFFLLGTATASAQSLGDVQVTKKPLVLKARGSFYVGGESVLQSHEELGSLSPAGHIAAMQHCGACLKRA